jgi:hypothetical protein
MLCLLCTHVGCAACRYPLDSGEEDDIIELESADHIEGDSATAVIHDDNDDDNDHIYDLGGNGRGTVSGGVLNVTCAATKASVKVARVYKKVATTDDDDNSNNSNNNNNDNDDAVYPTALGAEHMDMDDDDAHLDDDVYDMGGAVGKTVRAPEGGSGGIKFSFPRSARTTEHSSIDNDESESDADNTLTSSNTEPTYDILGAANPEDESGSSAI